MLSKYFIYIEKGRWLPMLKFGNGRGENLKNGSKYYAKEGARRLSIFILTQSGPRAEGGADNF